jgi:hypothetical protein
MLSRLILGKEKALSFAQEKCKSELECLAIPSGAGLHREGLCADRKAKESAARSEAGKGKPG